MTLGDLDKQVETALEIKRTQGNDAYNAYFTDCMHNACATMKQEQMFAELWRDIKNRIKKSGDPKENNDIITVEKVGEYTGHCREYYMNKANKRIYARQEEAANVFAWYTTTHDGEPEANLRRDLTILIKNSKRFPELERVVTLAHNSYWGVSAEVIKGGAK